MKKIITALIASILVLVTLAGIAHATVDVVYNYNVSTYKVEAFNCLDTSCSTVAQFSGTFPQGQTTTNGQLTIQYPSSLATPYGYATFWFAQGYLPKAFRETWHSFGNPAQFRTSVEDEFTKKNLCRAVVQYFRVLNNAQPHIPLVFDMKASLDATTQSAFNLAGVGVNYIPEAYKQEYYSADTLVELEVRDALTKAVEYRESKAFTKENNNALFANEQRPVKFTWTPLRQGNFSATVRTTVQDDQCIETQSLSTSKSFSVLNSLPKGVCYTILNDLQASTPFPVVGKPVDLWFSKISNHAAKASVPQLTPVPTSIAISITNANKEVVAQHNTIVGANPDAAQATAHKFTFQPSAEGDYTFTVSGEAYAAGCNGLNITKETASLTLFAYNEPHYTVTFEIVDALTGEKIQDATVSVIGQTKATDEKGKAAVQGFPAGQQHTYTISKQGYRTITGIVTVTNADLQLTLPLTVNNLPDASNLPPPAPAPSAPFTPAAKPPASAEFKLQAVRIDPSNVVRAGEQLVITLALENTGSKNAEKTLATAIIQELGVRASSGPFKLDDNHRVTKKLFLTIPPDTEAGVYNVRITVGENKARRVVYRTIEIIED